MDESEDEAQNPFSEEDWMKQNNCKIIKYVIRNRHPMTPEQLKQHTLDQIFKNPHEKVDTDEGESIEVEEISTTLSDMSKQDSESDINVDDTQDEQNPHTPEILQFHNTYNTTMHDKDISTHDEYDTSEEEVITEIETFQHYGEKIHETEESKPTETSQVLMVFNKAMYHEHDSSDDKSVIEIEPPKEYGEQEIGKQDKNSKLRLKTKKLKGS